MKSTVIRQTRRKKGQTKNIRRPFGQIEHVQSAQVADRATDRSIDQVRPNARSLAFIYSSAEEMKEKLPT